MKNEQKRCIRLALASYDMCELRANGNYITKYGNFSLCKGYQYGSRLLEDLKAGREYDVILLDDELRDMDAAEFTGAFYSMGLPQKPMLVTMSSRVNWKNTGTVLQEEEKYCIIKPYSLSALMQMIELLYELKEVSLRSFCGQLYREWNLDCSRRGCDYIVDAVRIALHAPGRLAIRKEILLPVGELYNVSVDGINSSIRRVIQELDEKGTPAWLRFKKEYTDESKPLTPLSFIYGIRQAAVRNNVRDEQEGGSSFHGDDTERPDGNG